ncbi:MAG TPA: von Willebrand factor type A domain-containing protein, partial [Planctomycetota bacterium]|nr:von Willebrand factor type A domain-containing protein [Planctomycetota bacterium]
MTHDDPRVTAWALGEGTAGERAAVEAALAADPALRAEAEALRAAAGALKDGLSAEPVPALDTAHRGALEAALAGTPKVSEHSPRLLRVSPEFGAVAATLLLTLGLAIGGVTGGMEFGWQTKAGPHSAEWWGTQQIPAAGVVNQGEGEFRVFDPGTLTPDAGGGGPGSITAGTGYYTGGAGGGGPGGGKGGDSYDGPSFHAQGVGGGGGGAGGNFNHSSTAKPSNLYLGPTGEAPPAGFTRFTAGGGIADQEIWIQTGAVESVRSIGYLADVPSMGYKFDARLGESTTESFSPIVENAFVRPSGDAALSTFSIDVDTAAYSIVRRCLMEQNRLPPPGALRIEELVNYFPYAYEEPAGSDPFAVKVDAASCPWNPKHRLVRVVLQGRRVEEPERPAANLVFLLDVSGSMDQPNKLPLVKQSIAMLAERLTARDRVAMVVYAGASGLALPSTTGDRKAEILAALERLGAGGSTNGAAGIEQAYQVASENFVRGGIN